MTVTERERRIQSLTIRVRKSLRLGSVLRSILLLLLLANAARAKPNILLIVSEDNGPELGCYGDPYAQTPNLDRLAAGGVRFERAFVPYSVCSPSRAAFLTGLYPHQNGQIGLATHKFALYDPKTPNAFTLLKTAGYRTGLIGKLHINPESAFSVDFRRIPGANFHKRNMEEYAAAAAEFFNASDQSFFLSINYPDAHLPFLRRQYGRPSKPLSGADVRPLPWVGIDSPRLREVTADYYNCLKRLDEGIGLLLAELRRSGKADDTLIAYIGDHGAQFPRGKVSVYEGGLRIPLILHWPGRVRPGMVPRELVSTVDILPTFLKAAGVEIPSHLPGLPLQKLLDENHADWRSYVYGFTTGSFPLAFTLRWSIRDDRYKLIVNLVPGAENLGSRIYLDPDYPVTVVPGFTLEEQAGVSPQVAAALVRFRTPPRFELFDLKTDPHEWTNLASDPDYAAVRRRLERALSQFRVKTHDPFLDAKNVKAFQQGQLAARDLAYRKRPDFTWPYLESFRKWRASRKAACADPAIHPSDASRLPTW